MSDDSGVPLKVPHDVQAVLDVATHLATTDEGVAAVGLAGSYARGAAGSTSDVDLVVLTGTPESLLENDVWFRLFHPRAELIRAGDFGAIQERRLRLPHGLVVEVGIGRTSWADLHPIDPGTRRVVRDGLVILYDPSDLLGRLARAVNLCAPGQGVLGLPAPSRFPLLMAPLGLVTVAKVNWADVAQPERRLVGAST